MNVNNIINGWAIRLVLIASVLNYAIIAYLEGGMPEIQPYLLGLLVMCVVAAVLQQRAKMPNYLSAAGIGLIGYGVYSLLMTFTMISTEPFMLGEEAIKALSFGVYTLAIFYITRLIRQ
jgi:uncharacterized membrane protein AbrB (regulator of aidB expression)